MGSMPVRSSQFSDAILDDVALQRLSGSAFRRLLLSAMAGGTNAFSPFVRRDNGRPPAHEWRVLREAVFARDDYTCQFCGERGGRLECDHIVAVSRGGDSDPGNLQTLCFTCNRRKWAH